jgi:iron complex transport system substrate-binding protein
MQKRTLFIFSALFLVICACICGCTGTVGTNNTPAPTAAVTETPAAATATPTATATAAAVTNATGNGITIVDDTGTSVYVPAGVERIVSLAPSITELYFAMTDENSTTKLVGRTSYDNYPEEALLVDSIGGMTTGASIESIISKDPDLIMSTTMVDMNMINQLRANGYPVLVFEIDKLEDIFENIRVMGKVLNEESNAESLITKINGEISEIEARPHETPLPKTMYAVAADPMYVTGGETYLDELITLAGGINCYGDISGYGIVTTESIIERQPEVIIVIKGPMDSGLNMREQILNNKELANVPAVKTGRIYTVDDDIVSRPGPRVGQALEILYSCISENAQ